jgi:hypothetical protein
VNRWRVRQVLGRDHETLGGCRDPGPADSRRLVATIVTRLRLEANTITIHHEVVNGQSQFRGAASGLTACGVRTHARVAGSATRATRRSAAARAAAARATRRTSRPGAAAGRRGGAAAAGDRATGTARAGRATAPATSRPSRAASSRAASAGGSAGFILRAGQAAYPDRERQNGNERFASLHVFLRNLVERRAGRAFHCGRVPYIVLADAFRCN